MNEQDKVGRSSVNYYSTPYFEQSPKEEEEVQDCIFIEGSNAASIARKHFKEIGFLDPSGKVVSTHTFILPPLPSDTMYSLQNCFNFPFYLRPKNIGTLPEIKKHAIINTLKRVMSHFENVEECPFGYHSKFQTVSFKIPVILKYLLICLKDNIPSFSCDLFGGAAACFSKEWLQSVIEINEPLKKSKDLLNLILQEKDEFPYDYDISIDARRCPLIKPVDIAILYFTNLIIQAFPFLENCKNEISFLVREICFIKLEDTRETPAKDSIFSLFSFLDTRGMEFEFFFYHSKPAASLTSYHGLRINLDFLVSEDVKIGAPYAIETSTVQCLMDYLLNQLHLQLPVNDISRSQKLLSLKARSVFVDAYSFPETVYSENFFNLLQHYYLGALTPRSMLYAPVLFMWLQHMNIQAPEKISYFSEMASKSLSYYQSILENSRNGFFEKLFLKTMVYLLKNRHISSFESKEAIIPLFFIFLERKRGKEKILPFSYEIEKKGNNIRFEFSFFASKHRVFFETNINLDSFFNSTTELLRDDGILNRLVFFLRRPQSLIAKKSNLCSKPYLLLRKTIQSAIESLWKSKSMPKYRREMIFALKLFLDDRETTLLKNASELFSLFRDEKDLFHTKTHLSLYHQILNQKGIELPVAENLIDFAASFVVYRDNLQIFSSIWKICPEEWKLLFAVSVFEACKSDNLKIKILSSLSEMRLLPLKECLHYSKMLLKTSLLTTRSYTSKVALLKTSLKIIEACSKDSNGHHLKQALYLEGEPELKFKLLEKIVELNFFNPEANELDETFKFLIQDLLQNKFCILKFKKLLNMAAASQMRVEEQFSSLEVPIEVLKKIIEDNLKSECLTSLSEAIFLSSISKIVSNFKLLEEAWVTDILEYVLAKLTTEKFPYDIASIFKEHKNKLQQVTLHFEKNKNFQFALRLHHFFKEKCLSEEILRIFASSQLHSVKKILKLAKSMQLEIDIEISNEIKKKNESEHLSFIEHFLRQENVDSEQGKLFLEAVKALISEAALNEAKQKELLELFLNHLKRSYFLSKNQSVISKLFNNLDNKLEVISQHLDKNSASNFGLRVHQFFREMQVSELVLDKLLHSKEIPFAEVIEIVKNLNLEKASPKLENLFLILAKEYGNNIDGRLFLNVALSLTSPTKTCFEFIKIGLEKKKISGKEKDISSLFFICLKAVSEPDLDIKALIFLIKKRKFFKVSIETILPHLLPLIEKMDSNCEEAQEIALLFKREARLDEKKSEIIANLLVKRWERLIKEGKTEIESEMKSGNFQFVSNDKFLEIRFKAAEFLLGKNLPGFKSFLNEVIAGLDVEARKEKAFDLLTKYALETHKNCKNDFEALLSSLDHFLHILQEDTDFIKMLKILINPILESAQKPKAEISKYIENKVLILIEKIKTKPHLFFDFFEGLPLAEVNLINFISEKFLLELGAIQAAFKELKKDELFISFLLMLPKSKPCEKAFLALLDEFSLKFNLELFEKALTSFNPWADFKNHKLLNKNQIQKMAGFIEKLLENNLAHRAMHWLEWTLCKVSSELKNITLDHFINAFIHESLTFEFLKNCFFKCLNFDASFLFSLIQKKIEQNSQLKVKFYQQLAKQDFKLLVKTDIFQKEMENWNLNLEKLSEKEIHCYLPFMIHWNKVDSHFLLKLSNSIFDQSLLLPFFNHPAILSCIAKSELNAKQLLPYFFAAAQREIAKPLNEALISSLMSYFSHQLAEDVKAAKKFLNDLFEFEKKRITNEPALLLACFSDFFEILKRLEKQNFKEEDVINITIELFEKLLEQRVFPPFDKMLNFLCFFKDFELLQSNFKEGIIHIFSALTKTKDMTSFETLETKQEFAKWILYFFDKLNLNAISILKILIALKLSELPEIIPILCLALNDAAAIERIDVRKMTELHTILIGSEMEKLIPKFAHLIEPQHIACFSSRSLKKTLYKQIFGTLESWDKFTILLDFYFNDMAFFGLGSEDEKEITETCQLAFLKIFHKEPKPHRALSFLKIFCQRLILNYRIKIEETGAVLVLIFLDDSMARKYLEGIKAPTQFTQPILGLRPRCYEVAKELCVRLIKENSADTKIQQLLHSTAYNILQNLIQNHLKQKTDLLNIFRLFYMSPEAFSNPEVLSFHKKLAHLLFQNFVRNKEIFFSNHELFYEAFCMITASNYPYNPLKEEKQKEILDGLFNFLLSMKNPVALLAAFQLLFKNFDLLDFDKVFTRIFIEAMPMLNFSVNLTIFKPLQPNQMELTPYFGLNEMIIEPEKDSKGKSEIDSDFRDMLLYEWISDALLEMMEQVLVMDPKRNGFIYNLAANYALTLCGYGCMSDVQKLIDENWPLEDLERGVLHKESVLSNAFQFLARAHSIGAFKSNPTLYFTFVLSQSKEILDDITGLKFSKEQLEKGAIKIQKRLLFRMAKALSVKGDKETDRLQTELFHDFTLHLMKSPGKDLNTFVLAFVFEKETLQIYQKKYELFADLFKYMREEDQNKLIKAMNECLIGSVHDKETLNNLHRWIVFLLKRSERSLHAQGAILLENSIKEGFYIYNAALFGDFLSLLRPDVLETYSMKISTKLIASFNTGTPFLEKIERMHQWITFLLVEDNGYWKQKGFELLHFVLLKGLYHFNPPLAALLFPLVGQTVKQKIIESMRELVQILKDTSEEEHLLRLHSWIMHLIKSQDEKLTKEGHDLLVKIIEYYHLHPLLAEDFLEKNILIPNEEIRFVKIISEKLFEPEKEIFLGKLERIHSWISYLINFQIVNFKSEGFKLLSKAVGSKYYLFNLALIQDFLDGRILSGEKKKEIIEAISAQLFNLCQGKGFNLENLQMIHDWIIYLMTRKEKSYQAKGKSLMKKVIQAGFYKLNPPLLKILFTSINEKKK